MKIHNNLFLLIILGILIAEPARSAFNHPGLLHSRCDLERIKINVNQNVEPYMSGFDVFKADSASKLDYRMCGPGEEIGRSPNVMFREFDSDANASYQLALMWSITGEKAYADKAIAIINAWSGKLERVSGRDAVLMGGLGPFKMVNAAEILRYTDSGWANHDIKQCERMFLNAIYPTIKDFAPFANGNWEIAAIQTVMAIGIFCNDDEIFERGLRYYVDGAGDGRLTHYVINEAGQCQESGRDQQHTQLGLALLAACCEIAWQQGLDLYAYDDYRLLKGFEYTAKYNLGEGVPFTETLDRTGKYHHKLISDKGRGQLRAVYEMVYNHYVKRASMAAPYTQKAAENVRPEGPGRPGADHPGFGTLLFTQMTGLRNTAIAPDAPAGLIAKGFPKQIELSWVASVAAKHYTVKRASVPDGPYEILAKNISQSKYTDLTVQADKIYYYTVSAENSNGSSEDAYYTAACDGLPYGWMQDDVGNVEIPGSTEYDGTFFTLSASGKEIGTSSDQQNFTYVKIDGDAQITARYVPQISSQFTRLGLMMRQSLKPEACHVSMLITPKNSKDVEEPGWYARLLYRSEIGDDVTGKDGLKLQAPYLSHYRMTGYCWMRLVRKGNQFIAFVSSDGKNWDKVAQNEIKLERELMVGLAVCSGISNITTEVKFGHVEVMGNVAGNHVLSPDGHVKLDFSFTENSRPAYSIDYMGSPIVMKSKLGFEPDFDEGFKLLNVSKDYKDKIWVNTLGELKNVPDKYNQMNVDLKHSSGKLLRLEFRAYNEGAAFRYIFPGQPGGPFEFSGELSEFRLPAQTFGYQAHGTEGQFKKVPVDAIKPWCERPLTLEYERGFYVSLSEAANLEYPRMLLSPLADVQGALVSALGGTSSNTVDTLMQHDSNVKLDPGDSTPWRFVIVGQKPGDLLERSYLVLNLNSPSVLGDTSWIKPGKVMRDTTLSTANSKAIIDFAKEGGLQYVHLDARWYGSEDFETGDAKTARVPDLDIQHIIDYGKEKGVGLLVYVDRRQIAKQRDTIFPLYEQLGIKGVKIGFIDVGTQTNTSWTTETIAKAAENHIMLNIHDGYRSTGINRTYPNLMTVEGIRGNEHMPAPEHNCTLPFTRYIDGIGDYTVCYYNNRIKTTHAHQLAMAVVSFSPLQWIYWYDKPDMYNGEPEIEFFRKVPTVWDETKVINGSIAEFATIARRKNSDWFIGTINNSEPRKLQIPLDFLDSSMPYNASIYKDDKSVNTRTRVGIDRQIVDSHTILEVSLLSGGGQAVWIKAMP